MKSIIQPEELIELQSNDNLVLIDARTGPAMREKYQQQHLKGALYVDLDQDLAAIKSNAAEGGRHPLPSIQQFSALLGSLGITPESHVVVYDDKFGSNAAARFWWMLRAVGHTSVQVLNGGFDAAVAAGFPVSSGTEAVSNPVNAYPAEEWVLLQVELALVEEASQNSDYMIIDVRDAVRYRGEQEPIDTIAGHIPNAVNIQLTSNLDEKGFFLSPDVLRDKYSAALGEHIPQNVIVHCGSGVTACHTLLAMDYAGLPIPNLYVGSWSEWSRNGKTIATGA